MRRLLVLRHAKSDWTTGVADHDRPINERGHRSAEAIGKLLASIGEVPDVAFTSTALRARTTVEEAALAGRWETTIEERSGLYGASVDGTLDVLATAPDVERVMLVGHEPTWSSLVRRLTGGVVQVKTATVIGIDLDSEWPRARAADGEIAFVLQARHFLD